MIDSLKQHISQSFTQNDTLIIIPTFNNPSHTTNMINQIKERGLEENTVICDNNSSSLEMIDYLKELSKEIKVIQFNKNLGPRIFLQDFDIFKNMTDNFIISDPDIVFNKKLPTNFIDDLKNILNTYGVSKVGFAIDISNKEKFFSPEYVSLEEDRNWDTLVGVYKNNNLYQAPIDTTFALYSKKKYYTEYFLSKNKNRINTMTSSIRVSGDFSCQHSGWWKESVMTDKEHLFYKQTQEWSTTERNRKKLINLGWPIQ